MTDFCVYLVMFFSLVFVIQFSSFLRSSTSVFAFFLLISIFSAYVVCLLFYVSFFFRNSVFSIIFFSPLSCCFCAYFFAYSGSALIVFCVAFLFCVVLLWLLS